MAAPFGTIVNMDQLTALLPPGVSLWWVRGKVLRTEVVERPIWVDQQTIHQQSQMAHYTQPDTLITLNDKDEVKGYEIRLQGRINTIAPGEDLELVGHTTPHDGSYLPRMAVSAKHKQWWAALPPLRQGDPDFIIKDTNNFRTMRRENSYVKELDGLFSVNVPKSVLASVPAPPSSPFGKILGAVKQVAASAAPAFITVDLKPVYMWVLPALVAYGDEQAIAEKPAQAEYSDDGDLPPL